MTPLRRSRVVAVLGLLALLVVSACRSDPDVAAYVGETKITQERVDQVVDGLRTTFVGQLDAELDRVALPPAEHAQQRAGGLERIEDQLAGTDQQIALLLVLTEAGREYAAEEELALAEANPGSVAAQVQLPADHAYVLVVADFLTVMNALRAGVEPVEPSDGDREEAREHMVMDGVPVPDGSSFIEDLQDSRVLGPQVALRDLLVEVVDRADVVVNPRYHLEFQVPVQVGQVSSWLGVPIGGEPAVVDSTS